MTLISGSIGMRRANEPRPFLRIAREPGAYRIEAHISERRLGMRFIERTGLISAAPESLRPQSLVAGEETPRLAQHARQRVGCPRDGDQMHVIRHQAGDE
jgi:hypothetical protein